MREREDDGGSVGQLLFGIVAGIVSCRGWGLGKSLSAVALRLCIAFGETDINFFYDGDRVYEVFVFTLCGLFWK